MPQRHYAVILFLLVTALLVVSGIHPYDRATWLMEVAPVLMVAPILLGTYKRFPLSGLLYTLIALHAAVLIYGGAYSYARVPLGFWLQEAFSLGRNHYDRIGHFMQGFVPALVAREILIRGGYLTNSRMLKFLCLCIAMAISAWYELLEWGASVALGQAADDFLGTQGDPWDTQWDMFMCFIGATTSLLFLPPIHDSSLKRLQE